MLVAPSLEGQAVDVIVGRLREQEAEVLAPPEILDNRFGQWERADSTHPLRHLPLAMGVAARPAVLPFTAQTSGADRQD